MNKRVIILENARGPTMGQFLPYFLIFFKKIKNEKNI
jgi:hypothetical protein